MQTKSALAGRNDRIISTTSASDETHSIEDLRPSFEAILKSKWRRGTIKDQTWQSSGIVYIGRLGTNMWKRGHDTRKV